MTSLPQFPHNQKWSSWVSLDDVGEHAPNNPGLYRVTHPETSGIDYVGYTGTRIRERLYRIRNGVTDEEMPYSTPHTATPTLWALAQELSSRFAASWISINQLNSEPDFRALKAAYLATYRLTVGSSPTANFGNQLSGYSRSSARRDNTRGKKESPLTAKIPRGSNVLPWTNWTEVSSTEWMGLQWSQEYDLEEFVEFPYDSGFIKIRRSGESVLSEISAEESIGDAVTEAYETYEEGYKISYSSCDFSTQQSKRELENDLVGAHYLAKKVVPTSSVIEKDFTKNEVESLIDAAESGTIELKRELDANDKWGVAKELIGLANRDGGFLLAGVTDPPEKEVVGESNIKKKREQLSQFARDAIMPKLRISVHTIKIRGEKVLLIEVPPIRDVPYSYKGTFYYRSDTTTDKLDGHDLKEIFGEI